MSKLSKEYVDELGYIYHSDEHMRNKLNKIFGGDLKAVYTKWKGDRAYYWWDIDKQGISASGESDMYILNSKGVMYCMGQSEWFHLEEV